MTDFWNEMRHVRRQLDRIEAKINVLNRGQLEEIAMNQDIQDKLDAASAQVNRLGTVEDSNRVLLQHLVQLISDLKSTTTDPAVLQAIDDLVAGISGKADTLAADVVANTPAENTGGATGGTAPTP